MCVVVTVFFLYSCWHAPSLVFSHLSAWSYWSAVVVDPSNSDIALPAPPWHLYYPNWGEKKKKMGWREWKGDWTFSWFVLWNWWLRHVIPQRGGARLLGGPCPALSKLYKGSFKFNEKGWLFGCLVVCFVLWRRPEKDLLSLPPSIEIVLRNWKLRQEPPSPRDPPVSTHRRVGLTGLCCYTWLSYVDPEDFSQ